MAYDYIITKPAKKDIDETINYISEQLCNKQAAKNLLEEIYNTLGKICVFPKSYPSCTNFFIDNINIRHAIIKNYYLVFEIFDNKIIVLRFKYSKQNKLL